MSRTNIDIDDKLAKEGLNITHLKTKNELVNFALQELIKRGKNASSSSRANSSSTLTYSR